MRRAQMTLFATAAVVLGSFAFVGCESGHDGDTHNSGLTPAYTGTNPDGTNPGSAAGVGTNNNYTNTSGTGNGAGDSGTSGGKPGAGGR